MELNLQEAEFMIREMYPSPLHAAPPSAHPCTHAHAPRSAPQYSDRGDDRLWKTLVHGGYLLPWMQTEIKESGKGLSRGLDMQSSWAQPVGLQAGTTATLVSWAPGFSTHV